jgi:AP-4 complex subunit mu-1
VDGINYAYIKLNSLFVACTTRFNVAPSYIIELLDRLAKVIKDFCGVMNEEAIRKNFVMIYEILDEMIDFGYPELTSTEKIKEYIVNTPIT